MLQNQNPTNGLVKLEDLKFFDVLVDLYPVTDKQVKEMVVDLRQHGQITPVTVTMVEEIPFLLHGHRRVKALIEMGETHAKADVIECPPEEVIVTAITANAQREKSHVTMGKEVKYLKEYATQNLPKLQMDDPELGRAMEWVAGKLGYKSKDTAYKLLKIVNTPTGMYCLNEVDTGELSSLQAAYEKACGIQKTPPVRKPLSPTCAPCNYFKDGDGNVCPRYVQLSGGGNNE